MSAARDLAKLGNTEVFTVDTAGGKVGVDSTSPVGEFQVGAAITVGSLSGIISATAFYGDGSNLDGVSSAGLGTALSETDGDAAKLIYYTDSTLGIGSTVNIKVPTGSDVAYTQYTEIAPEENVDFIVSDGDDFIPDVLGISTAGGSSLTGSGGRIRVGSISNRAADGAPQLTYGAEVPVGYGITGAGGINIGGAATITATTQSTSTTTGALIISGGVGIAKSLHVGGDVSVGGTLTYEDVINIDSIGIITARSGVYFGAAGVGGTITGTGQAEFAGVVTATTYYGDGSNLSGIEAGISTTAGITTGAVRTLNLGSYQDHKETVTGFVTFSSTGGSEGDSHTIRIINSGIATVGFNTYFLWPSGSSPTMPTADGAISLISFTIQRVGTAGTQLLAGASLNFS